MRLTLILAGLSVVGCALAQPVTVTGNVTIERKDAARNAKSDWSNAVVWLKPAAGSNIVLPRAANQPKYEIRQTHKRFEPHILAVPMGSTIWFPNLDPFFHNVFSLYEGNRFDLGLYEAGATHSTRFDRPGICFIFCNIHPEMSGVVITLNTPFYAMVHGQGPIEIANVPFGRYQLHVWSEGNGPENTQPPGQELTIAESSPKVVVVRVPAINRQNLAHKNKYGRDYDPPTPDSPIYHQQP